MQSTMKAIVVLRGVARGEKSDSLKFEDDATGILPPIIEWRGGAKDGQKLQPKSLGSEPEAGRLVCIANTKELLDVRGALARSDKWEIDEDTGNIDAYATLTFKLEEGCRLHGKEVAALMDAGAFTLQFTPSQKTMELKDPIKKAVEGLQKLADRDGVTFEIEHEGKKTTSAKPKKSGDEKAA